MALWSGLYMALNNLWSGGWVVGEGGILRGKWAFEGTMEGVRWGRGGGNGGRKK